MSKTTPIRTSNAIDEIAFVILFEKELDDTTFSRLTELEAELCSDLPDYKVSNVVQMVFDPEAPRMPVSKQGGVVCSKKVNTEQSRLEWSVRVEANNIIVTCSEYTNWNEVWDKAKGFLLAAVNKFNLEENPVVEIVLQCVDKFIFDEDMSEYKTGEVFNEESSYLTRKVTANNPDSWHIHQGWFEASEDNARILHNLNLNAHKQHQLEPHITSISHLVKIRMADGSLISDNAALCGGDGGVGYLEKVMIAAHTSNKKVLLDLLSDSMLDAIGLTE